MSWIVMSADADVGIFETFDQKTAQSFKPRVGFIVAPSQMYLESFNKAVRENNGTQPPYNQILNNVKNALSISLEK